MVVMPDANFDKNMENLMNSIFGNSGQRCLAGKKLLVVGDNQFYENFKARFVEEAKKLKVGNGLDEDTF
jgi:acyl-CoA reductase-like NAD-dependent aldehyde dehydrogenase